MGFFKSLVNTFSGGMDCPGCGTPGAKKSGNEIKCLNPVCRYFGGAPAEPQPPSPQTVAPKSQPPRTESARPASGTISIQYVNFQGEHKTFVADAASLRRKNNHIIATVAPNGKEIALSRKRIQNLREVDVKLPERDRSDAPRPTARERQVLGYHRKHGTTSPLYEKVKAKYPQW